MSQFFIIGSGGGGGGSNVQTLTGDSGGAVPPTANNINVVGGTSTADNSNGITVVGTPGTSTETFTLTNRIVGTATTTDGVTPVTVYSFSLGATPATFLFFTKLVAYDLTGSQGAGYSSFRSVRTSGVAGTLIGADAGFIEEEGDMTAVNAVNQISGNNQQLVVTGVAGRTIHWKVLVEYITVS